MNTIIPLTDIISITLGTVAFCILVYLLVDFIIEDIQDRLDR